MNDDERQAWVTLLLDMQLGPYRPNVHIASGAFSFVFEATDTRTNELVALKVLQPSATPEQILEFQRERDLLKTLARASNVVDVIDSSSTQISVSSTVSGVQVPVGISYHALELASGCLEELVLARDQVSIRERLMLWRGAILGIHQMHLKKIVHRDLKSANCLLFVGSKSATVCKTSDLGRARNLTEPPQHALFQYLAGLGDFRFAPPEFLFFQGKDDPQAHKCADLYGLGSVLCEVITGQGITSLALGFGPEILKRHMDRVRNGQQIDLSSLRNTYTPAYRLFEDSTPNQIKKPALDLLKQLCDPVPEMRLPQLGPGRRRQANDELSWLLRRADILIKGLARSPTKVRYPRRTVRGSK